MSNLLDYSSDDSSDTDEKYLDEKYSELIYLLKINNVITCYCKNYEEINDNIKYIVEKIISKFTFDGFIVFPFEDKWKFSSENKIVSNIYGRKINSITTFEQVIASIEIEMVPYYGKSFYKFLQI